MMIPHTGLIYYEKERLKGVTAFFAKDIQGHLPQPQGKHTGLIKVGES